MGGSMLTHNQQQEEGGACDSDLEGLGCCERDCELEIGRGKLTKKDGLGGSSSDARRDGRW